MSKLSIKQKDLLNKSVVFAISHALKRELNIATLEEDFSDLMGKELYVKCHILVGYNAVINKDVVIDIPSYEVLFEDE
jgi:hypothetical protein